jgi:plasmid maintenance system antidote protein VapI
MEIPLLDLSVEFIYNFYDFWMNLQLRWNLYFAQESETDELRNIKPISPHQIPFNVSSAQHGAGQ